MRRYILSFLLLYNTLHAYVLATSLESNVTTQSSIEESISFSVKLVNREKDGSKQKITKLSPEQKAHTRWRVTYKNDRYTDNEAKEYLPKEDEISADGLRLTLKVNHKNIYKYLEVSFDLDGGGRDVHQLDSYQTISTTIKIKRKVTIEDIVVGYSSNSSLCKKEGDEPPHVIVELVYDIYNRLRNSERERLRWKIDGVDAPQYNGKEYFIFPLDREYTFKAYFEGREDEAVSSTVH